MRPSRKILNYITTFIFDLYKLTHFEAFSQLTQNRKLHPDIYETGLKNQCYISNKTNIYNNDRQSFFDIMLKDTMQSATSVQSSYIYCFFIG